MKRRAFLQFFGLVSVFTSALLPRKAFGIFNVLMMMKKRANQNVVNLTISADTQNYNVLTAAVAAGMGSGTYTINLTINSGVYVWSDAVNLPALTTDWALNWWDNVGCTLNIINNGYIMGKGGEGGTIGGFGRPTAPGAGGPAIYSVLNCNINSQTGYILAGGGGGGSGLTSTSAGGGGAGGGKGGDAYGTGGAGGAIGSSGSDGANPSASGGGGGRVVPGTATAGNSVSTASAYIYGAGGSGGGSGACEADAKAPVLVTGGSGGGVGVAGGAGVIAAPYAGAAGGGGGGWGAYGGDGAANDGSGGLVVPSYDPEGRGAAGGTAIDMTGHSLTWVGGLGANKVYGSIV